MNPTAREEWRDSCCFLYFINEPNWWTQCSIRRSQSLCGAPHQNGSTWLAVQYTYNLRNGTVKISFVVRNLELSLMSRCPCLTTSTDSSRTCFYQLYPTFFANMDVSTVNSFVISQVDYCNSILASLPKYQLDRIQSSLTIVAILIFGRGRNDLTSHCYCKTDCIAPDASTIKDRANITISIKYEVIYGLLIGMIRFDLGPF